MLKGPVYKTIYPMQNSRTHSSYLIVGLVIAGISFLFLSLLASLLYLRFNGSLGPIDFPLWFLVTSLFLILVSYFAEQSKTNFRLDQIQALKQSLLFALAAIFLFLLSQLRTWMSLLSDEAFAQTNNAHAFLYLLSALHLMHVIAAIPFVSWYYLESRRSSKENHLAQLFFADSHRWRMLDQITIYLHFMGVLWGLLLISFVLMAFMP